MCIVIAFRKDTHVHTNVHTQYSIPAAPSIVWSLLNGTSQGSDLFISLCISEVSDILHTLGADQG